FSGCASTPAISALPKENQALTTPLRQAEQTSLYQQVTGTPSPEQLQQQFKTIAEFIQAGKSTLAKNTADEIDKTSLSTEQSIQLDLLYGQIMLSFGEAEQAIEKLTGIQTELLSTDDKIKYYQSLAFAHSLTGNLLESAKSRIALNQLLTDPQQYDKNQAAILEGLGLLPDSTLLNPNQSDNDLAGWMAIARVLKLKGQASGNFNAELAKWRETYPGHSANSAILALEISNKTTQKPIDGNFLQPNSIALFLPESGQFAQAGKALFAGFMAAYNSPNNAAGKPGFRLYNSEQSPLPTLYNQAISDGADLIIGPLSKENIQSLADTTTLTVPVLALNHIPTLQKDNLYQFSLSPMDDVAEITNKAWQDGRKKALLLVPENEQGQRISNYFSEYWQRVDGVILDTQTYNPQETDFSATIKKLLNLNESEYRYRKIAELIPGSAFTPRRRQDVDTIFLSAHSNQARLINPQLQFHHAAEIPVYAMPNSYSGLADPALDADLNQITFCDTPWLFNNVYSGEFSMNALRSVWQNFPSSYLRLIAMGIDAYHLALRLNTRDIDDYPGATGKLTLTPDNRIKRSLTCAQFIDGKANVLDAPSQPASAQQIPANPTDNAAH
ncbi:MAG: penicillin-binding protein activator, partial [Methylococcales bacterium]